MNISGLSQLNVELTSRCSKETKCFMCGHQSAEINPRLQFGDMDFALIESIERQIDAGVIVSLHRDGDSVDYPRLGDALRVFKKHPVSLVTHGERLAEKADEIIDNCTTVTVSIIPNDPDKSMQYNSILDFLNKKGERRPQVQLKAVGNLNKDELFYFKQLGLPIIGRSLHNKRGNWTYQNEPPIPEIRVCLDFLGKPTIDWRGRLFICNRLDTSDAGLLGDLNVQTLDELWNGDKRKAMLQAHLKGRRQEANSLCATCNYWGIPAD